MKIQLMAAQVTLLWMVTKAVSCEMQKHCKLDTTSVTGQHDVTMMMKSYKRMIQAKPLPCSQHKSTWLTNNQEICYWAEMAEFPNSLNCFHNKIFCLYLRDPRKLRLSCRCFLGLLLTGNTQWKNFQVTVITKLLYWYLTHILPQLLLMDSSSRKGESKSKNWRSIFTFLA